MALATATITGKIFNPTGTEPQRVQVTIRAVADHGVVKSTTEHALLIHERTWQSEVDGTLTVPDLPLLPQAGVLPPEARWRADIRLLYGSGNSSVSVRSIEFQHTGATTWDALVDVSGAPLTESLLAAVNAARDAVLDAVADAETARNQVLAVPTTTDGLIVGRINDPTSATAVALATRQDRATGAGDLLPVRVPVVTTSTYQVVDTFGGKHYAYKGGAGNTLARSSDEGVTWTDVHAFTGEGNISGVAAVPDGEVLVFLTSGVYRSTGWASNPMTATWTKKVITNTSEAGFAAATIIFSNWDVWGNYVLVNEYGSPRNNARYTYLSTDGGVTFTPVFDLNTRYPSDIALTHFHGAAIDGFKTGTPRLWVCHGDGPRGIFYSDDLGVNWTSFTGGVGGAFDPTVLNGMTLTATPAGMVVSTDSNAPDGLYRILRTPVAADMVLERMVHIPYPYAASSLLGFGIKAWRDPVTNIVYVTFKAGMVAEAGAPAYPGYVFASDGVRGSIIWTTPELTDLAGANRDIVPEGVVTTASGQVLVSYRYGTAGTTFKTMRGQGGGRGGLPFGEMNAGNALSGKSRGRTSVGIGAFTTAYGNSVLIGARATTTDTSGVVLSAVGVGDQPTVATNATAVGYRPVASTTRATALGSTATASGGQATALGANTVASGNSTVVVGHGASAAGVDSTAVGFTATSASSTSVVIGRDAIASDATKSNLVVIGRSASGTGNGSVAIGQGSNVVSGNTVVIGKDAAAADATKANAVALGYQASAANSGAIAVGQGASAAGLDAVVLGRASSSSTWLRTVVLGAGLTSTANDQVLVGAKHFELQELAADPPASATTAARFYVKDDATTGSALYLRTATGTYKVTMS